METITAIVLALAAGAKSVLMPTATKLVVQDLYDSLKNVIREKYQKANASLEALENKPDSSSKRESLQEDLQDAGAEKDTQLLQQAQALLKAVEEHAPQAAQAIGVKLEDVKAANVRLQEIIVSGEQATGVDLKGVETTGDIDISKVGVSATKK